MFYRDFLTGKMDKTIFMQQKIEILSALVKLGEALTAEENSYFDTNSVSSMKSFAAVQQSIVIKEGIMDKLK